MNQEIFTEQKYKQIVLLDSEFQRLIDQLNDKPEYGFMSTGLYRYIIESTIDIPKRNFDLQINYIQKIYDITNLHRRINELEQTIKKKDEELDRLRFDKTAALREFVEELRKEPLQVVLMGDKDGES
jgi:hypothetical protein